MLFSLLLSFLTFYLVSKCILNQIYNHSNFVNYYVIIKYLSNTFIKIDKYQFYAMFIDSCR